MVRRRVSPVLLTYVIEDRLAILKHGRHSANAPVLELVKVTAFSILEVILIAVVGYIMARRGVIDKKTQTKINKLNVSVFTPALLFSKVAFSLTPGRLVELAVVPIGFVLVSLVSALSAYLLGKALRISKAHRNFAIACAISPNSNSLPVALMQSLVATVPMLHWEEAGESEDTADSMLGRALTYLVLFSTLGMFLRWSIGASLLSSVEEAVTTNTAEREAPSPRVGRLVDVGDADTSNNRRRDSTESRRRPQKKRSGPPGWAISFPNSPVAEENIDEEADEDELNDTLPPPLLDERPTFAQSLFRFAQKYLLGPVRVINSFMTAPLWAAVLSLVVALIPPLQKTLVNMEPVVGALETAGATSIPLTLVCLGSYFYVPAEQKDGHGTTQQSIAAPAFPASVSAETDDRVDGHRPGQLARSDSDRSLGGSEAGTSDGAGWRATSWNPWRNAKSADGLDSVERNGSSASTEPYRDNVNSRGPALPASPSIAKRSAARQRKEENKTIAVAILARMFVSPLVLMPVLAWYAIQTHYNVVDDPVFICSAALIIISPPALTLAQITTQSAGSDSSFERLISRTLFIAYTIFTAPMTIVAVMLALVIAEND